MGFLDRAQQITPTVGTSGPLLLTGLGVPPYRDWPTAGAVHGESYDYVILDSLSSDGPDSWEVCHGVYDSSGPSITRVTDASSLGGTSPINLSGTAIISMEPCANTLASFIPQTYAYPRVDLSGLSTYTWSSILQNYNELELVAVGRTTAAVLSNTPTITVNGLGTAIYSMQRQYATSTTNSANQFLIQTSLNQLANFMSASGPAGAVTGLNMTIYDYAGATLQKVGDWKARHPQSTTTQQGYALHGTLTIMLASAITSLTLAIPTGTWVAGSYGILRLKS